MVGGGNLAWMKHWRKNTRKFNYRDNSALIFGFHGTTWSLSLSPPLSSFFTHTHTYNNYVRFQNSPFFSLSILIIDNRLTKEEEISSLFVSVNVSKASRDFSKNPRSLIIYRSRGNYFASGNFWRIIILRVSLPCKRN